MHALGYYKLGRNRPHAQDGVPSTLRLVLFGFAGGTVTALHCLADLLPSWIEVWGAEYPGRGMRWREPKVHTVNALLDDLQPGLMLLSDMPLALLGYSMGAHIAYRAALRAQNSLHSLCAVITMSARPPVRKLDDWESECLTDMELIARLEALGGMPVEILNNSAMLEILLPVMRADLAVCADINNFTPARLPCPLLVMEGKNDCLLADAQASRWLEVAGQGKGQSCHRLYDGGHFFHKGKEARVANDIAEWLAVCADDASVVPSMESTALSA